MSKELLAKVKNWLRAKYLETHGLRRRDVLQKDFHEYLLSIGAPVVETVQGCVDSGWVRSAGRYTHWDSRGPHFASSTGPFYEILATVMEGGSGTLGTGAGDGLTPEIPAVDQGKRRRRTKIDVKLRTHAAIVYKAEHPEATEDKCAAEAQISRTTLAQQQDWLEWVPKIERAAASGKLPTLRKELDKRTDQIIPTVGDDVT